MTEWIKRNAIATAVVVVMVLIVGFLYTARASAADKGGPEESPLIPGITAVKGWSGPYIGVDAGVNVLDAQATRSRETVKKKTPIDGTEPPAYTYEFNTPDSILNADNLGGKDWTYGVRGGFDFQFLNTPLVIGVLGGYGWGGVDSSMSFAEKPGMELIKAATFSIDPTWHVGGRVGLVLQKTLVYVGGAWAQAEASGTVTVATAAIPTKLSSNRTVDGYMILAGLETVIAPTWTLGVEYTFTRYDTASFVGEVLEAPGPDSRHSLTVDPDVHAFKVRLNWRPFSK